jgi:hypothetical protein
MLAACLFLIARAGAPFHCQMRTQRVPQRVHAEFDHTHYRDGNRMVLRVEVNQRDPVYAARSNQQLKVVHVDPGIAVAQSTVAKYMKRTPRPPSPTWRTFLANQASQIMAADFLVVPTATYRWLFVLVILAHERGRIVHGAVTAHPTAAWTAQQFRNAVPCGEVPTCLLHDRDGAFATVVTPSRPCASRKW